MTKCKMSKIFSIIFTVIKAVETRFQARTFYSWAGMHSIAAVDSLFLKHGCQVTVT